MPFPEAGAGGGWEGKGRERQAGCELSCCRAGAAPTSLTYPCCTIPPAGLEGSITGQLPPFWQHSQTRGTLIGAAQELRLPFNTSDGGFQEHEVAFNPWTPWPSLCADWTFLPGLFLWGRWRGEKKEGKGRRKEGQEEEKKAKEGKEGKKDGRKCSRNSTLSPGGPSFREGPSPAIPWRELSHLLLEQASQEEEREDKSLMPNFVCVGTGESGPPKSHNNPNVCLSAPSSLPLPLLLLMPLLLKGSCLEWGLVDAQKVSSATDAPIRDWAFFPPFLSVSPASSACHDLQPSPAPWGRGESGERLRKLGDREQRRVVGGLGGLPYLKWLFMILILIYAKILRPCSLKNCSLPLCSMCL